MKMIRPSDYPGDRAAFIAAAVAGFRSHCKPKRKPKRKRGPKPKPKRASIPAADYLDGIPGWPDAPYTIDSINAIVLSGLRTRGASTIDQLAEALEADGITRSQVRSALTKCRSAGLVTADKPPDRTLRGNKPSTYKARRAGEPAPPLTASGPISLLQYIGERWPVRVTMREAAAHLGRKQKHIQTWSEPLKARRWISGDGGRPERYTVTDAGRLAMADLDD